MLRYAILALVYLIPVASSITCYSCSQFALDGKCSSINECTRPSENACYVSKQKLGDGTLYYQSGCAIADPNSCTCEQAGCRITDPTKDIQCCPDNDCNSTWESPDSSEGDGDKNYNVDDDGDSDDTKDKETEKEIEPQEEAVSDKDSSSFRSTLSALLLSSFIGFFLCH